jgi:hypothetical protein
VDRGGELYLCKHCANLLWPALSAQGWEIWLIAEQAIDSLWSPASPLA